MVKSCQKYARQHQNIVKSVRLVATRGTQALKILLSLSPVMMGIGAQVLFSTAQVGKARTPLLIMSSILLSNMLIYASDAFLIAC